MSDLRGCLGYSVEEMSEIILVLVEECAVIDWFCLPWVGDLEVVVYMPPFLDTAQDKIGSNNYRFLLFFPSTKNIWQYSLSDLGGRNLRNCVGMFLSVDF